MIPTNVDGALSYAKDKLKDAAFRLNRMGIGGALLKARTFHEMGRLAEEGMQHVVRGVEDVWSKVESTARRFYGESDAQNISRAIADEDEHGARALQELGRVHRRREPDARDRQRSAPRGPQRLGLQATARITSSTATTTRR